MRVLPWFFIVLLLPLPLAGEWDAGRWELQSAAEIEEWLAENPQEIPSFYAAGAKALQQADADRLPALGERLAAVARTRAARPETDLDLLIAMMLVSPQLFFEDPGFRERISNFVLPKALSSEIPRTLRERVVRRLSALRGFGFDEIERLADAWTLVPRTSLSRLIPPSTGGSLGDVLAPIEASFYSLPADLVTADSASSFLRSVHEAHPRRQILVLSDPPLALHLDGLGLERLQLLPAWGIPYSLWPRDPLTILRDPDDGLVAVLRPNIQSTREADLDLGRALVQTLPESLDTAWGGLRWRRSEIPFHNGQVLFADGRAWVGIHSLEVRILEILQMPRIPVEDFGGPDGVRFLAAAQQAAAELEKLYGRPVSWVHDLPTEVSSAVRVSLLRSLGGGAGFDLDSLLTLLETDDGLVALVGDPRLAAELLDKAPAEEFDTLSKIWTMQSTGEKLQQNLITAQVSPRARGLGEFLDQVAEHLGQEMLVRRLPLLLVPGSLVPDVRLQGSDVSENVDDFLLGWNNVVLEEAAAEGFASGWATGDAFAHEAFGKAGHRLVLHPPLTASVIRGGGYRCASQHVRR